MLPAIDNNTIGRLRAHTPARDEPRLRLGLSNTLNRLELRARGLAPTAILLVRKLADPMPGKLSWNLNHAKRNAEWERAMQDQLDSLHRVAAKPSRGFIPDDCEAVVFSCEAQLLACLAFDMARGVAHAHWCWRLFFKHTPLNGDHSKSLFSILGESLNHLPAVFEQLHDWHATATVLQDIKPEQAAQLCDAMLNIHGYHQRLADLNTIADMETNPGTTIIPDLPDDRSGHIQDMRKHRWSNSRIETSSSFWNKYLGFIPLSTQQFLDLGRERLFFLGLGLMLNRWPWRMASNNFQLALARAWQASAQSPGMASNDFQLALVQAWQGVTQSPGMASNENQSYEQSLLYPDHKLRTPESTLVSEPSINPNSLDSQSKQRHDVGKEPEFNQDEMTASPILAEQKAAVNKDERATSRDNKGVVTKRSITEVDSEKQGTDAHPVTPASINATDETLTQQDHRQASVNQSGQNRETAQDAPSASAVARIQSFSFDQEVITTNIGGVLYLINLMNMLDLPVCFEQDWQLASRVGPWAVLELLGRVLLAGQTNRYDQDPLWDLLAKLDGRQPSDPPGGSFKGNRTFRLPPAWFDELRHERDTCRWSSATGRLRLWTSSGVLLVDVPRTEDTAFRQAGCELHPYQGAGQPVLLARSAHAKAPVDHELVYQVPGLSADLGFWLTSVMSGVRYRLVQALGDEAPQAVLSCRAKVYLSSSHVDLVTGLDNISLAARRSGLDRDPGWMPGMGKVVLFHFE